MSGTTVVNSEGKKEFLYSEIFYSLQGEGRYTGLPTVWLRYFFCNLNCNGFGQEHPTQPKTHDLPYKTIDIKQYKSMEELPVFAKGCDSSYSWAKKFKALAHRGTPEVIAERMIRAGSSEHNPLGKFVHPSSHQPIHACFTGGEPLMPHAQECTIGVVDEWVRRGNYPSFITFETNGTQKLSSEFFTFMTAVQEQLGIEIFFSVSPKLWSVSGEEPSKAINPDVVAEYRELSPAGQLKFVSNGTKECWEEIDEVARRFRLEGVNYPVWIMGVGGTKEGLVIKEADIAREAIARGYNYTTRAHVHIFGNGIGT